MQRTTKLRSVGSSVGAILPKELLEELRLASGDELFVVRTSEGILLTPYDADFAEGMAVFERGRKKYRNALRELAR